ncbi:MAG: hypothetical protein GY798_08080 [Hyphomicrobiales bacterium]|nr:hypothetical protein [Hyphomicrobiales bacterium]
MATGPLAQSAFEKGSDADDLDDRIIYDKSSGQLHYDEDGLGGADKILVAEFDAGQKLKYDDFNVAAFIFP